MLKPRKKEVIKHSAAIQIENKINLLQRRAWNVLLAYAYDDLLKKETHRISVTELMDMLEFTGGNQQHLKESLKALTGNVVEWNILDKDGTQEWAATALLAHALIRNGVCTYSYSAPLRERLHNPNMYARISLSLQNKFDSKHALALYELCVDYLFHAQNYGETGWIELPEFRRLMGISEEMYPAFKDLNKWVIKPSVKAINIVLPKIKTIFGAR